MSFLAGVVLVELAILFLLTSLALAAGGLLRHPPAVAATLLAVLALGIILVSW